MTTLFSTNPGNNGHDASKGADPQHTLAKDPGCPAGDTVDTSTKRPVTDEKKQPGAAETITIGGYRSGPDGLYRVPTGNGERPQCLTNFPAKIINELIIKDGTTEAREFEIEATVGKQVMPITVPAAEFESMTWVAKQLGAEAILTAGYGIRDHVRAAIQHHSSPIPKIHVYINTGWVYHCGKWVFLHAGGAIEADSEITLPVAGPAGGAAADAPSAADEQLLVDPDVPHKHETAADSAEESSRRASIQVDRTEQNEDRPVSKSLADNELEARGTIGTIQDQQTCPIGIRVRLPSVLQDYRLPPPAAGDALMKAVRASLDFIDVAADRITIPLYAAIWRAVLGDANLWLQLVGKWHAGKTALAALAQQHFGAKMDAEHLPAAWFSTGNAIVATAYLAKNVLLTVDDLVFKGSRGEAAEAHKKAELVLRSQANRAGRARCRGDGSLVEGKQPQGLIVSTGEDTPDGRSLNSRGLILSVSPGDLNWKRVTKCQGDAAKGLFALAMSSFLRWMAKNYEQIAGRTQKHIQEMHRVFLHDSMPSRTAMIAANLMVGFNNFLDFAADCGAIGQAEFEELWYIRAHDALRAAIQSHTRDQDASDPIQRFRELLAQAFHAGRAHVANRLNEAPNISPEDWGWEKQIVTLPNHDAYRPYENIAEEQQATIRRAAEESQDGIETRELYKYIHRGGKVGWWDFNDDLYLLPDEALRVVQGLAQASDRPLSITHRTLGKLLDAQGFLKSKRKDRYTKQITVGTAQVSVYHVAASWINPLDPDPLSAEEQEEQRKRYDDLLDA